MIINGGSRSNGAFFAKHLTNAEHNERVTLREFRNLAATNIGDAFREMQAIAMGTRCENYFYHANINPRQNEALTPDQWQQAVNLLEKHLRLEGHGRFVVEHQKTERTHRHAVWSRIDVNTMRAVKMTDDYEKHQAVARELERLFNLERSTSVLGQGRAVGKRPPRRPKTWESFRGQKSGIDVRGLTDRITELYRRSNSAAEFKGALAEHGCRLVNGNRSALCVVDKAGDLHSLARRIQGTTLQELQLFFESAD